MVCNHDCFNCVYDDCISDEISFEFGMIDRKLDILSHSQNVSEIYNENKQYKTKQAKYLASPKGKEAVKRYNKSDKGKERTKKYNQSEKGKERRRNYDKTPKRKEYLRRKQRERYYRKKLEKELGLCNAYNVKEKQKLLTQE